VSSSLRELNPQLRAKGGTSDLAQEAFVEAISCGVTA
jgi:hypothetical protein